MGTQINCHQKGWELPRKCPNCRELFRHKPFKTLREETVFGISGKEGDDAKHYQEKAVRLAIEEARK
jgi:hypothetical protein